MSRSNTKLIFGAFIGVAALLAFYFKLQQNGVAASQIDYYSGSILTNKSLPQWDPFNPIPLAPDRAVSIAAAFANSNRPSPISWQVDWIELRRASSDTAWFYRVALMEKADSYETMNVRVLLNGEIWKPMPAR